MFGFLGHWQATDEVLANGEAVGSERRFYFRHTIDAPDLRYSLFAEFDFLNEGSKPQQYLNSSTWLDWNNDSRCSLWVPLTLPSLTPVVYSIPSRTAFQIRMNSDFRGWRFTSASPLSPPTRRYRVTFNRPDAVTGYYLVESQNNQANADASNQRKGDVVLDLRPFINLNSVYLGESRATSLSFKFPEGMKSFSLHEHYVVASINGKLPSSVEFVVISGLPLINTINEFISEASNVLCLTLLRPSPIPTSMPDALNLSGTIMIGHMTKLKELAISNSLLTTSIQFPLGKNDWEMFTVVNTYNAVSSLTDSLLDEVMGSVQLTLFAIHGQRKVWNRNFTSADFANLILFSVYSNTITGNISCPVYRPLKELRAGNQTNRGGTNLNTFPAVDISGLTDLEYLDLSGCWVENLTLPPGAVKCKNLYLFDNKLDHTISPNLISRIGEMTALTDLRLGNNSFNPGIQQNSPNGLGSDIDFSLLSNVTILVVNGCKISGDLTLPFSSKLTNLNVSHNPDLENLVNLDRSFLLQTLTAIGNTSLHLTITSSHTAIREIRIFGGTIGGDVDMSGKNTTAALTLIDIESSPGITTLIFPAAQNRAVVQTTGNALIVRDNPNLTSVLNCEMINYPSTNIRGFIFNNNALNQFFPFGVNGFIPNQIQIQDNGMSSANVDATITSIYTNRAKWNPYNALQRNLQIGGSNAPAGGIYQAPAGFVKGSNDGSPASAKEMIYVLVENYAWTITFN